MKRNLLLTAIAGAVLLLAGCGKEKEPPVPVITIGTQPTAPAAALVEGNISGSLTIAATVTEGAELTYQWYTNTSAGNVGGTAISGATSATYAFPATLTVGTYHYFCEVGAQGAVAVRSSVVTVSVESPEPPPPPQAAIELAHPSHAVQTAWADEPHTGEGFTFTALADWTAEVTAATATRASGVEWVRLMSGDSEKYDGEAGTHTLVVALDPNYSGEDRTAKVTLTASGESVEVNITHAGTKEDGTPHNPPPAPTYSISASPATLDFGSPETPYTQPEARTVTVTNTGTGNVTLSAPPAVAGYTVGALSTTSIAPEETATFSVRPNAGLAVGDHNGTITLSGNDGAAASVAVSFSVRAATPPALVFTDSRSFDIGAMTQGVAITNIDVSGAVSGGTAPYTFSAAGLPTGIVISTAGVISGAPTTPAAATTATVRVEDSSSPGQSRSITIAVGEITAPPSSIVPVTNIINVPTKGWTGEPVVLQYTDNNKKKGAVVVPDEATNKEIVWSVTDGGTTGLEPGVIPARTSRITSYVYVDGELFALYNDITTTEITAPNPGGIVVTATIVDGVTVGSDYTQDFAITILARTNDVGFGGENEVRW